MRTRGLSVAVRITQGTTWLYCLACILMSALACRETASVEALPRLARFLVEVASLEQFRIELRDPGQVAQAESLMRTGERAYVVGDLAAGDGGFNAPYHWHLSPGSVRFTKDRQSACDALPSEVEENLDHWLRDVGTFCPSASRIATRER
jgi:hypothetical protein